MAQSHPAEFEIAELHDKVIRAAGEDKQGMRLGLATAGAALGASVGLIATFAAGIPSDNPVAWLAIGCAAAIGAVLGA